MLCKTEGNDLFTFEHNSLDRAKSPSIEMPKPICLLEVRIIRGATNLSFKMILRQFNFKKGLSVEVLNISLFSFVDPKEHLCQTIICKVVII